MRPDGAGAAPSPEAFFLPLQRGQRFCLRHRPTGADAGAILFVHAFAEELNKARRMASLQARALADEGWTVLQMDLFGCGDSDGEFADAGWSQWVADVCDAAVWLREQTGATPALWGMRVGCLLATEAAARMTGAPDLLFWQPVLSGKQALQQFLRLRVAGQWIAESDRGRPGTDALRQQVLAGSTVEVAGYELPPGIARGLDASILAPAAGRSRTAWLEVVSSATNELTPASRACIESWRASGCAVEARAVAGPAFWQTVEIAECPALIDATRAAVAQWRT